ncbi:MAG: DEAD/DEAH box helicase, partial [Candidatus Eremiobacteraeota bacterium]|nr:DEAD/DEAH box helicase [Candidatus Eremiobacteraeota bacterium]
MALRVIKGFKPRDWAKTAYAKYLRSKNDSFLVDACPGAGKTKFAVMVAVNELHRGTVDRVDIVGPSVHICRQWAEEMAAWGVHLDSENDQESADCVGRVFTYQRLGMGQQSLRTSDRHRRLVILDEIHHAGDNCTWGDALRNVFFNAERRLLLSGTPFRSDGNPIPFVHYSAGDHGVSVSDYSYGYGEALRDGYCAPLYFPHHDGDFQWERGGEVYSHDLSSRLTRQMGADRLRTAYAPEGQFVTELLKEAHQHLMQLRNDHPQAGGIVFGRDVANVRALADVLERVSGTKPVTVTNDDKDAAGRINRFRQGSTPWLVSVKMVSEGVDIPRLRVGVFLTNVKTEMFFRQAAGRLVRLIPGLKDQSGYLYIPSIPRLVSFATEIQRERNHYVELKKEGAGMMDLLLDPPDPFDEEEKENDYQFLKSAGEKVGVIESAPVDVSGQHFFDFAADLVETEPEPPPQPQVEEAELLQDQKATVRKRGGRISSLVRQVHLTHKVPFGAVHARLNKKQRINSQAECTLEQLAQRERLLMK